MRGQRRRPHAGIVTGWRAQPAGARASRPSPVLGEAIPPAIPTTTEDTSAVRTYSPKPGEVAPGLARHRRHRRGARPAGQPGRELLRGKHKPQYAPHVDTGDFVVIVNAGKVALTGNKREQKHGLPPLRLPGWPASDTSATAARPTRTASSSSPSRACSRTTRLGRQMLKKLKVYAGPSTRTRPSSPSLRDQAGRPVTSTLTVTDASGVRIQTVGRRKEAIVRVRLVPGHRPVQAQRPHPRGVLPEQGAPAAHPRAVRDPREGRAVRRHRAASRAAASPARPARCAWPSPARSSSSSPTTARR